MTDCKLCVHKPVCDLWRNEEYQDASFFSRTDDECEFFLEERRWIPVSDPPKEKGCYFVTVKHWYDGKPVSREAYWNGADWLSCEKRQEITPRVTHWMPMTEPQKGE